VHYGQHERKWFIRNIAEVKWREFPDHSRRRAVESRW
jgi:hypothetical protein